MYKFQQQKGYTLIELMIGLLVGLIVLSAVIYTFLSTLRSSRDITNSARINREMSVLVDTVVGELRRTGYYPVALAYAGSPSEYGVSRADLKFTDGDSCIVLGYYDDSAASAAYATRGFKLVSSAMHFGTDSALDCSSNLLWSPITDTESIEVTSFDIDLVCTNVETGNPASTSACTASTTSETYSRAVSLALSMQSAADNDWKISITEFVKIQNDLAPD